MKSWTSIASSVKVAMVVISCVPCQKQHHHNKELYWECKFENSFKPTEAWGSIFILKSFIFCCPYCCQITKTAKIATIWATRVVKISHHCLSSHAISVDVCPALQSFFEIAGACFQSLKREVGKKDQIAVDCDSIYITGFYQLRYLI